jgi:CDGSH-type Zn-finger protein
MADDVETKLTITENGPYLVYGSVPLTVETIGVQEDGGSWDWRAGRAFEARERYALCRCGQSSTKPYCDGTHAKVGFDGTETASREPYDEQAGVIDGPALLLQDAESLCAFARFCDNFGSIWRLVEGSDDPKVRRIVEREGTYCPSGRLVLRERASGKALEPKHEPPSIGLVEDPAKECSGPLWVRGGIRIESSDGEAYETRNRVTLCRCGQSENKPFCDGSHASIGFKDGLA